MKRIKQIEEYKDEQNGLTFLVRIETEPVTGFWVARVKYRPTEYSAMKKIDSIPHKTHEAIMEFVTRTIRYEAGKPRNMTEMRKFANKTGHVASIRNVGTRKEPEIEVDLKPGLIDGWDCHYFTGHSYEDAYSRLHGVTKCEIENCGVCEDESTCDRCGCKLPENGKPCLCHSVVGGVK